VDNSVSLTKVRETDATVVEVVRRFNRTVTQRVGALQSHYLAHDRSLGASRVLWEIGTEGRSIRDLRASLDLDSGYLSRLLRSLERAGLVDTRTDPQDGRVRTAVLTPDGIAERSRLDEDSDALAWSFVEPLTSQQRAQLLDAMSTVERLLSAGMVEISMEDPGTADARWCIESYFATLDQRFESGFDPAMSIPADVTELRLPHGLLLVARLHGRPIGCGALKLHGRRPAEIKRMWVSPDARGLGLGRRLLVELERHAGEHGARRTRLETNRALREAISLYRSAGYVEVPAFNEEPYAHHWFEKRLRPPRP
jgi:DNA-binding MarR family transcriptional regulator/GNAT superfamily N-acetyltransferase